MGRQNNKKIETEKILKQVKGRNERKKVLKKRGRWKKQVLLKIRQVGKKLMLRFQVWNGQRSGPCARPKQFTLKMMPSFAPGH